MSTTEWLFVYGTLRRNCSSGAHQKYLRNAHFIDFAKLRGELFQVSYYPAAVLCNELGNVQQSGDMEHSNEASTNASWIFGEVYQLPTLQQLQLIDAYEECQVPPHPEQEYQRELVTVVMNADQSRLTVWTYLYRRPTTGLKRIISGDFLVPR